MRLAWMVLVTLAVVAPASAQTSERLPWFAVDVQGAWVGLPSAEGWVPPVPLDTPLPGRGWGLAGGATVYPLKLGIMTLGLGVSMHTGKSTSDPLMSAETATTPAAPTTTTVTTQITSVLPQVSINFGHKLGWSYLSAGYGQSKVASSSEAFNTAPALVAPEAWSGAINFGGGARWFMRPHLGASFDVRFTKLGTRGATETLPAAKRTQMFTLSIGISIQ
jgi:hypothetical protein